MGYRKDHPESIQNMFGSIAGQYDRTNAVLSFQMHRYWNNQLLSHLSGSLLDLCAGTGEIGFSYLKKSKRPTKIYMLDFCEEMLGCAKLKGNDPLFRHHDVSYIQADAQAIPLQNACVQSVSVAYGIRNIHDPKKAMDEVFRVLEPGGTFAILELTEPSNRFLQLGHKFYLKTVLPLVGKFLTSNGQAYEYLCNSINAFVKPEKLEIMLQEVGFQETTKKPLSGGIATIISGRKPL